MENKPNLLRPAKSETSEDSIDKSIVNDKHDAVECDFNEITFADPVP